MIKQYSENPKKITIGDSSSLPSIEYCDAMVIDKAVKTNQIDV